MKIAKCIGLPLILTTLVYSQTSGFFVSGIIGWNTNTSERKEKVSGDTMVYIAGQGWVNTGIHVSLSGDESKSTFNFAYGARIGYVFAINGYNALRFYGTFMAGDYMLGLDNHSEYGFEKKKYYFMQAGGGIDYMLSFSQATNSWGIFIGGGYEYGFGELIANGLKAYNGKISTHIPFINAGFFKAFGAGNVSLEFGIKVPFATLLSTNEHTTNEIVWSGIGVILADNFERQIKASYNMQGYTALTIKF